MLARHVVGTLLASDGVDGVVVVTADPAFTRESLAGLDVEVLEQPVARPGLNAALEHAREVLAARAPSSPRLLVAHADLPALTRADVMALLAEPAPVVIATDRNRSGTNLLLVPSPSPAGLPFETEVGFRFRFGVGSLAAHLVEAAAAGLDASVVHRPGTAVDLDTADDWAELPAAVRAAVGREVPGLM